jgi:glycosyltransferase involved in cell wall biosynthesis
MACGVPVVASAVGVNEEIIEDGTTGFLARSEDEWVEKLSLLIQDAPLRQKLGLAGRQVVEEGFSLRANEGKFLTVIEAAVNR